MAKCSAWPDVQVTPSLPIELLSAASGAQSWTHLTPLFLNIPLHCFLRDIRKGGAHTKAEEGTGSAVEEDTPHAILH